MGTLISVIHIVTCVLLVLVVLIQSGRGAEVSASFGGSSQTVFGSSGGANFFSRFTGGLAAIFMITSIVLTVLGTQQRKSVFEGAAETPAETSSSTPAASTTPATPAAPPADAKK